MEGTIKASKRFITFQFDPILLKMDILLHKNAPELGYYWAMGFIDDESYMVDILTMDEAREMYE